MSDKANDTSKESIALHIIKLLPHLRVKSVTSSESRAEATLERGNGRMYQITVEPIRLTSEAIGSEDPTSTTFGRLAAQLMNAIEADSFSRESNLMDVGLLSASEAEASFDLVFGGDGTLKSYRVSVRDSLQMNDFR